MELIDDHFSFADVLREEIAAALTARGIEQSEQIAERITDNVRNKYGGESVYLNVASKKSRNQEIIAAWRSKESKHKIAYRFDIHVSTVNRIISNYLQNKKPTSPGFADKDWLL